MSGLIMAAQLILGLSILVILHELGHFMAARAFGIRVEKFYLFFDAWGVKLFKYKKGNIEYGIGWLPLGGYVKISGMIDESMDKEAMKQPPQPWEFRSKPAWQRLIVMIAGVLMNVILGIIIYSGILLFSTEKYLPNDSVKDGIYAYPSARQIGFQTGDKILSINGKKFERFEDVASTRMLFGGTVVVEREGLTTGIIVPDTLYRTYIKKKREPFISAHNYQFLIDSVLPGFPAYKAGLKKSDKIIVVDNQPVECFGHFKELLTEYAGKDVQMVVSRNGSFDTLSVKVDTAGIIGILQSIPLYTLKDYTVFSAIGFGASDAIETLVANAKGLGKIFQGKEKVTESVQGPIGIAKIYGGVWDWFRFWTITGMISMVLAFMNILPIPALDGGHVIFLVIEAVTRRKFSDKFMERVQLAGMIILITLMVFIFGNDIFRLFK